MKIGIYGGTFNPPHIGHVSAATDAIEKLGIDKLFVIPDTVPPHKSLPDGSASAADRLNMTKLAFQFAGEKTEISDIETKREGKSYTIDTVNELARQYPGNEITLLVGTDMFLSLETWHEYRELLSKVRIGVFARNADDEANIAETKRRFENEYGAKIDTVGHSPIEISSSEIRNQLPQRRGREYLSEAVYAYIIKNGLYGAKPAFDWLRVKSYEMLALKRIPHVCGCEAEAVKLAARYGADVDTAREAAILHDCTKKHGLEEQLALCKKYGIETDISEETEGKLLHSVTGSAIAKYEFGLSREAYEAIRWHTTGKPDMSLMEKIIYLADYIEPTRDFDGLEELRKLTYEDLDEAMIFGLQMSIDDMHARGIVPHENSRNAIDWLVSHKADERKG